MEFKIKENRDNLHELINACLVAKKEGFKSFTAFPYVTGGRFLLFEFKRTPTEKERLIKELDKARLEMEELKAKIKAFD